MTIMLILAAEALLHENNLVKNVTSSGNRPLITSDSTSHTLVIKPY